MGYSTEFRGELKFKKMYIVELESLIYLADATKKDERTMIKDRAKKFETVKQAEDALIEAKKVKNYYFAKIILV